MTVDAGVRRILAPVEHFLAIEAASGIVLMFVYIGLLSGWSEESVSRWLSLLLSWGIEACDPLWFRRCRHSVLRCRCRVLNKRQGVDLLSEEKAKARLEIESHREMRTENPIVTALLLCLWVVVRFFHTASHSLHHSLHHVRHHGAFALLHHFDVRSNLLSELC